MTLGSLFDGSGGFPLAGTLCGIEPLWASEIEPFPIAVTKARFPHIKHYGDVSQINGAEVPKVDIITFGSPCQDLSVAGKRAGIQDGARSSLFFQAVRIIEEMRDSDRADGRTGINVRPRFAVWENVPGAFSSNKGEDFRQVLEELAKVADGEVSISRPPRGGKWQPAGEIVGHGWSIAWRVFDAQFWGVHQRRKRIYLVADFASERVGDILFEPESQRRYPSPCGAKREEAAGNPADGVGAVVYGISPYNSNCMLSDNPNSGIYEADTARTLDLNGGNPACNQGGMMVVALEGNGSRPSHKGEGYKESDTMYTLNTTEVHGVAYDARGNGDGKTAPTITGDHNDRITDYTTLVVTLDCRNAAVNEELSGTLQAKPNGGFSHNCINPVCCAKQAIGEYKESDKSSTCAARDFKDATDLIVGEKSYGFNPQRKVEANGFKAEVSMCITNGTNPGYQNGVVTPRYIVRRLTPTECARLQGFPDWWCSNIAVPDPTEEQLSEWREIFETHRRIVTHSKKPKTDNQIRKFLAHPHSDAAEYKMWGNGIALPCAVRVMQGIVHLTEEEQS